VTVPVACAGCLRRAWLVAGLADRIEAALGSSRAECRELLALEDEELAAAVGDGDGEAIERASAVDARRATEAVRAVGCWSCCRHDPRYPPDLLNAQDAPAALFGLGDPAALRRLAAEPARVTIVGTRRPSAHGRDLAERLAGDLAGAGAVVISGMAYGIDAASHEGALGAGGLTVAVLGAGPEAPSPRGMAGLHRRIAAEGLVVSELPPGTTPRRWTFPARNRIMAALGRMTVVVEARARSGSLITSGIASQLGREVGAVPGQVGAPGAEGTNGLLREGAQVVRGAEDVLDSLLGAGAGSDVIARAAVQALDPEVRAVLDAVTGGSCTPDGVAATCGLDPGRAAAALVRLEIDGHLRSDSGGRYRPVRV
jgi:DNA processing protein